MMLGNKCPIDYSRLCRQTVTVYHEADGRYTQKVYPRAFLDFRKTQTTDKTGSREANSFLLVIPGDVQAVSVGDKILMGHGPEISSREDWAALTPVKVPGLVVVKYVDPKYWGNRIVHTEAGG